MVYIDNLRKVGAEPPGKSVGKWFDVLCLRSEALDGLDECLEVCARNEC